MVMPITVQNSTEWRVYSTIEMPEEMLENEVTAVCTVQHVCLYNDYGEEEISKEEVWRD